MVGVQVDDGAAALLKDAQLGAEVVVEVLVLDGAYVVEPDVEETAQRQLDAVAAVVLERLAGHLHDKPAKARVARVGQVAPEVGALGRGVAGGAVLDAVVGLDGTDHAAGAGAARVVDDGAQHIRAGRLALGAGDADDGQVAVGVAERGGGREGHRAAKLVRGHGERREGGDGGRELGVFLGVAKVSGGAGLGGGGEESRPEGGALAYEDVARANGARVAGGTGDDGVCGRGHAASRCGARLGPGSRNPGGLGPGSRNPGGLGPGYELGIDPGASQPVGQL